MLNERVMLGRESKIWFYIIESNQPKQLRPIEDESLLISSHHRYWNEVRDNSILKAFIKKDIVHSDTKVIMLKNNKKKFDRKVYKGPKMFQNR